MMEKEFQFKTNINCSGCVASVKSHLDKVNGICEWNVDTENQNKVLTVKADGITEDQIIGIVKEAGFNIETLNS